MIRINFLLAMLATAIAVAAQDQIPEQTTPAAPASPQEQVEQKSEEAGKSDGKSAFKKVLSIFSEVKIGGLGVAQYQASTQEGAKENSFILRYIRLSLEGRICKDFFFKIQGQLNGNTNNLGSSPRLLDAFLEWQRLPYLKIKIGQYKRPFTIENPLHPVDQGFMNYSQSTLKLAGMSDRIGEHASNGRDIGLQIQGDFLPDHSGRNLLHYQIGVFNGQGINTKDTDKKKDIIGGAWVAPVKGLRIGGFGWLGTYTRGNVTLDRKRYAISAEYDNYDWIVRSEYVHSYGYSFKTTYQNPSSATDLTINEEAGAFADGFYVLCVAPIIKGKLYGKARYDMYRPRKEWSTSRAQYEIGAHYDLRKHFRVSAEYARIHDRSLATPGYNIFDIQVSFRF